MSAELVAINETLPVDFQYEHLDDRLIDEELIKLGGLAIRESEDGEAK